MPGLVSREHSHRPTTKVEQKPFKSRFTSKNELRERSRGRLDQGERPLRRTRHQHVMSKLDRKNHAKQLRVQNAKAHEQATNIFKGKDAAPRIVAVVPLCEDIGAGVAIRSINESLGMDEDAPHSGSYLTEVGRFKQQVQYILVERDLLQALDACRVADYVLLILSAKEEVDSFGETILRSIESQGISNVVVVANGLEKIDNFKHRQQTAASLRSFMRHFLPSVEKVFSLDLPQDCLHVMRSLCTTTPKGFHWRQDRSWMFVEQIGLWGDTNETSTTVLTGVIRGQSLKADRLIHVSDWGDFQIDSITAAPRSQSRKGKQNALAVDGKRSEDILDAPSGDQDTLEQLAPQDVVMDEVPALISNERKGVLLDDMHYYSGEEDDLETIEQPKRLPKGTSSSQSAWYLGYDSDSGSDMQDFDQWEQENSAAKDATVVDTMEDIEGPSGESTMEHDVSDDQHSEMFLDPSPEDVAEAEELAAYREKRREADAEEHRQFPDEIELQPHTLARERLAKYRGLKSLKTSVWDIEADKPDQPSEWTRLLDISDYRAAKSKVIRDSLVGGVKPGTRVHVQLKGVPRHLIDNHNPSKPLTLFSLLRHEHKFSCINMSLTLKSDANGSIKSKDELVVQVGPRRFTVNPLFSQPSATPNDVHKFERYLHPGRTAVASFIAPVTWGNVPVLFFQHSASPHITDPEAVDTAKVLKPSPSYNLVGTGTTLPPSTSRVIAKRAVLTGQPYKIHKRLVTVRYMFFNKEDVAWFKALPLWTNRGRQGTIKESLGTHGYYKATFDGRINPMEAVGVSLYKRVWPKIATPFSIEA